MKRLLATGVLAALCLGGCSNLGRPESQVAADGEVHGDVEREAELARLLKTPAGNEPWRPFPLPGKRFSEFQLVTHESVPALAVESEHSVSILRRRFPGGLASADELNFSWKVDALPEGADLSVAGRGDAAVRLLLTFDGDMSKWSERSHRLSELSRLITGEPMPYATLMYVWSNQGDPGQVLMHPRTDRIRNLVLESGGEHVGQWRHYRRNIRSDYVKAFGEEPGPLKSIAIMTDTDNTKSRVKAWYGPLVLSVR